MSLHPSTFQYHQPTSDQTAQMQMVRDASATYAKVLDDMLPDGPDKTYVLRMFRTVAMWSNIAITRQPDGTPRGPLE